MKFVAEQDVELPQQTFLIVWQTSKCSNGLRFDGGLMWSEQDHLLQKVELNGIVNLNFALVSGMPACR